MNEVMAYISRDIGELTSKIVDSERDLILG